MYQSQYEREKSRQRSRDRQKKHHAKSPSEDSSEYRRYKHSNRESKQNKSRARRVKQQYFLCNLRVVFQNVDVRVFRKEDEPNARGLCEQQIIKIKAEVEKEIAKSYDFNWQHYKHRDALLQSNSMKEQKQREKALTEKLMAVKQQIVYYPPVAIRNAETLIELGVDSVERQAHTARIHDILGCYYTHLSEIPNQPQFQIINTNSSSECKLIKFDNDTFNNDLSCGNNPKKTNQNAKPLKGILKLPNTPARERQQSEPRSINPNLIYLLKDIKLNPTMYSKDRTEQLLKPYKDSGELEYLTKNKEVLEMMLKNSPGPAPTPPPKQTFAPSSSAGRESNQRHSYSAQPQQHMQQPQLGGYGHTFVPKADKYRTVPCKYYHGPQGCNKIDNCTYIHDERYPGVQVPLGQSGGSQPQGVPKMQVNYMQPQQPQQQQQPQNMYNPYPAANMPGVAPGGMSNAMGHPGYMMGAPMPYGNPGYYGNNNTAPTAYSGGGYPQHYMGGQYGAGYSNPGYGYYGNGGQGQPKQ